MGEFALGIAGALALPPRSGVRAAGPSARRRDRARIDKSCDVVLSVRTSISFLMQGGDGEEVRAKGCSIATDLSEKEGLEESPVGCIVHGALVG